MNKNKVNFLMQLRSVIFQGKFNLERSTGPNANQSINIYKY